MTLNEFRHNPIEKTSQKKAKPKFKRKKVIFFVNGTV